ncbi:LysR family transcriptional regulator [Pseudoxanthomonas sp. PXM01]|uniref:LysR family transcriptional regulator n=1 Tax=Pseudoxanthomonas sp. PXM01 TaxID=2769295 RepID=UPI00177DC249|nr:LysR family transcriptional regulator [Pseudoxanthomonas sp. PXM01]MBD9469632.1 LysR family transcriptional regulator [Pseudoxanthomonas sp. PXM01]
MARPDIANLNTALWVARHRNFRRAAAELGMSPSAVSHAISDLEDRLGVRLFNRTTRSVSLTPAGEEFIHRVEPALQQLALALEAMNQHRETPSGRIRLNTSVGGAHLLLAPILLPFLALYPEVQVELALDDGLIDIVDHEFDIGARLIESVPKDMVAVLCSPPLRLVAVASPAYVAAHGAPHVPEDLLGHACFRLRFPNGGIYKWEFSKDGVTKEIDVRGQLTLSGHHDLALQGAIAGHGVALVAEHVARPHLERAALVTLLDDWTPPFPGLALFYPPGRPITAALRAFIDHAKSPDHWPQ